MANLLQLFSNVNLLRRKRKVKKTPLPKTLETTLSFNKEKSVYQIKVYSPREFDSNGNLMPEFNPLSFRPILEENKIRVRSLKQIVVSFLKELPSASSNAIHR